VSAPYRTPDPPKSLLGRIAEESTRFAVLQAVGSVLVAVTQLVLAKLLTPRAFGVYAIGTFFLGLGAVLGDGGLGATLLRRRGEVKPGEYEVTITFLLGVGLTLCVAFVLGGGVIARRYHLAPDEAMAVRLMAPLFLVGPLRAVPYIRLQRDLQLARIARIELAATFARQCTALLLAWKLGGAWALVGAQLAAATTQLTLSYRASPGFAGLSFAWRTLRPLLADGVKVQGLAIAAYFKDNLSAVLLGALVGPQAVGIYDYGVKYAQVPVLAVNALSRVQMPVYSRYETHDPELYAALVGITRVSLIAGTFLLVAMTVAAPALIPIVAKPEWLGSVPVVWGLAANMAGGLLAGPLFTLLQSQGRAGLALRVFGVWTTATWVIVLAVWRSGLGAIALAHSVATVAVVAWLVAWAGRTLARPLASAYVGPLTAGFVALVGAWASHWVRDVRWVQNPWALTAAALVVYAGVLAAIEGRRPARELRTLVGALRKKA
jgi:PST family polysaccharide transporter